MDLTYATIIVLASMMFVLSAMVGYLYWQHTRLHQSIQSLAIVVSTLVNPPVLPEPEPEAEPDVQAKPEEDDRVSVTPPPPTDVDVDDLQTKTAAQLRELLEKKGIPYGKRDSKTTLIELLKATA